MTRKERVISNLSQYPNIKRFLVKAVRKRLEIKGYTRGMLTAHLLDEPSKTDLAKLEHLLQLGGEYCTDFKRIFEEMNLPDKDLSVDGEIINTLSEVKAFEFLQTHNFEGIQKIKTSGRKTVDFTATKNGQNYAVEVMRFGLTQSKKKEPKYLINIADSRFSFQLIGGRENIPVFKNIIGYAIRKKYPQIKDFCQRQQEQWKGILLLSIGRDYFISNKYANNPFNLTPSSTLNALKSEWSLITQDAQYEYLKHVIITIGKDLDKVIIYPPLFKESPIDPKTV